MCKLFRYNDENMKDEMPFKGISELHTHDQYFLLRRSKEAKAGGGAGGSIAKPAFADNISVAN
jgi:hypothetical protein